MIVYRQHVVGVGAVEFFRTKAEAEAAAEESARHGLRSRVEQLDVDTSHQGVVNALNRATMHPDHWWGNLTGRYGPKETK